MNRYPRKPAVIVLLVSAVLGVVYVIAWSRVEAYYRDKNGGKSVEAIEKKIAEEKAKGTVSAVTWLAYGEALMDAKNFDKAAVAFKKVMELDPKQQEAKFKRGIALAQSGAADLFYQFQEDLVLSEPKLAYDVFQRTEAQKYLVEERFSYLAKEAKNQAMD
jgi:cytochrome c-type biogenesis protein CcmH/NrfG